MKITDREAQEFMSNEKTSGASPQETFRKMVEMGVTNKCGKKLKRACFNSHYYGYTSIKKTTGHELDWVEVVLSTNLDNKKKAEFIRALVASK